MSDPSPSPRDTFSLEIPSDPTVLSSARLFAAAVAREAGCAEALLDDVKLAVSEACAEAIRRTGADGRGTISLRADVGETTVAFEVEGPTGSLSLPEDDLDHFSLVSALFDDARRSDAEGHSSIAFSAPLS